MGYIVIKAQITISAVFLKAERQTLGRNFKKDPCGWSRENKGPGHRMYAKAKKWL